MIHAPIFKFQRSLLPLLSRACEQATNVVCHAHISTIKIENIYYETKKRTPLSLFAASRVSVCLLHRIHDKN